jgi:gluconate kinase
MKSLQLEKPHAIVVIGIQGSGKSFFAEKFAETFSAPYIDDRQFVKFTHNSAVSKKIANTMLSEILKTSKSLVYESNISKTERIELARKLKRAGYTMLLVWVQTDTNTAMNRARKTQNITAAEYKENLKKFSAPAEIEQALVISGKHTFASQAKTVLKKITNTNRPPVLHSERNTVSAPHRSNIVVR